jgi:hypothetical protein
MERSKSMDYYATVLVCRASQRDPRRESLGVAAGSPTAVQIAFFRQSNSVPTGKQATQQRKVLQFFRWFSALDCRIVHECATQNDHRAVPAPEGSD